MLTHHEPTIVRRGAKHGDDLIVSANGHGCFSCGKPCVDPAIVWSGMTGASIVLHLPCAVSLCVGLLIDVRAHDRRVSPQGEKGAARSSSEA